MIDVKVLYQDDLAKEIGAGLRMVWDPITKNPYGNFWNERGGVYLLWTDWGGGVNGTRTDFGLAISVDGGRTWIDGLHDPTYQTLNPDAVKGKEPWIRFIYKMQYTGSEWRIDSYTNGKLNRNEAGEPAPVLVTNEYSEHDIADVEIIESMPLWFMTGRKSDKTCKGQYDMAALAVWDRVLSDEEIATLGSISK
jgi:hypothetical protein